MKQCLGSIGKAHPRIIKTCKHINRPIISCLVVEEVKEVEFCLQELSLVVMFRSRWSFTVDVLVVRSLLKQNMGIVFIAIKSTCYKQSGENRWSFTHLQRSVSSHLESTANQINHEADQAVKHAWRVRETLSLLCNWRMKINKGGEVSARLKAPVGFGERRSTCGGKNASYDAAESD